MNLLGKILTGLILVMSIFFLGFAVLVYATHRNWNDLVNNSTATADKPLGLKSQLRDAADEGERLKNELDTSETKLAMERAARRMALARLESERQQLQDQLRQSEAENVQLVEQERQATATLQTAQENLGRLKDEVENLRDEIRVAQKDRDSQFEKVVQKTDLYNQAQSKIDGLQNRVDQLTERIGRQAAVLDKNSLTEFDPVIDIPPRLEGVVLDVNSRDLIEISVGSDDGLRKGHELEISRGDKYLGRIVIVDAFPKRAVGEIVPELRKGRIRRGDRVFTKV